MKLTNYAKGIKKANSLISLAIKERDKKGYRENLGYDSMNKLTDFLNKLTLSYKEQSEIEQYFFKKCNSI